MMAMTFATGACSLGSILVAATDKGIAAILLGDDPNALVADLQQGFPRATLVRGDESFTQVMAAAVDLVEDPSRALALPIDAHGTTFQQQVWQVLRKIPAGSTMTYAEVAGHLGAPGSARAVARACAANTIAVAVPCHRVVRSDRWLSGYRWGVERKRALLEREKLFEGSKGSNGLEPWNLEPSNRRTLEPSNLTEG
jgi:AraC family transcriptional regulator, regulatory protein of adaptative response / methylated-DNA-[protein]-cysteine methyltransferase